MTQEKDCIELTTTGMNTMRASTNNMNTTMRIPTASNNNNNNTPIQTRFISGRRF